MRRFRNDWQTPIQSAQAKLPYWHTVPAASETPEWHPPLNEDETLTHAGFTVTLVLRITYITPPTAHAILARQLHRIETVK